MKHSRLLFISILGLGAIATGYGLHNHIVNVRAAKLDHIAAPAPYFPPGAIWTQDISHAPLDPQSLHYHCLACGCRRLGNRKDAR
jgi:hypothetical protein